MEGSIELNNILESISKWVEKHKGKVQFICTFLAFKGKGFEIIDDRLLAYGTNGNLREALVDLDGQVEKEKGEFVNW